MKTSKLTDDELTRLVNTVLRDCQSRTLEQERNVEFEKSLKQFKKEFDEFKEKVDAKLKPGPITLARKVPEPINRVLAGKERRKQYRRW